MYIVVLHNGSYSLFPLLLHGPIVLKLTRGVCGHTVASLCSQISETGRERSSKADRIYAPVCRAAMLFCDVSCELLDFRRTVASSTWKANEWRLTVGASGARKYLIARDLYMRTKEKGISFKDVSGSPNPGKGKWFRGFGMAPIGFSPTACSRVDVPRKPPARSRCFPGCYRPRRTTPMPRYQIVRDALRQMISARTLSFEPWNMVEKNMESAPKKCSRLSV